MHPCGEMKDRAHKAGTLALTSAPPLQTSFNLWEADKFLSVFLAQPPQTPYSSRLKTVRSRLPLTTRQRGKHVLNEGLGLSRSAGSATPGDASSSIRPSSGNRIVSARPDRDEFSILS